MTFHRRCGFCIALLLTAPAALGQEALVLIPRAPAKGKPFKVNELVRKIAEYL